MKKKLKQALSAMLAIIMVFSMVVPVSAQEFFKSGNMGNVDKSQSAEASGVLEDTIDAVGADALEFSAESVYAIVSKDTGKAINATAIGWTNHIMVQGAYHADTNQIEDKSVRHIITTQQDGTLEANQTKVMIQCYVTDDLCSFRTESGNDYSFADADRYDQLCEMYIITKTGENEGIIQAASNNRYATVSNGELKFKETTTKEEAAVFTFAQNPKILDTSFTIEHVATGKYVQTAATADTILRADAQEGAAGTKFAKAVFGTNNNNEADVVYDTVSFVSDDYGNAIKSVTWNDSADASNVLVADSSDGSGWESIRVIPNGDGTVSFKDSYYDQYITVENGQLAGRKIKAGTTKEELTDNEKFIIHTAVAPQAVTDLTINPSSRTETTLDVSWTNPNCIYSDLKLQQKDNLGWTEIADVSGMNSYTVKNLTAGTKYEFRLVISNGSGEEKISAEGNEVSAKTRSGAKPATPSEVTFTQSGDDFVLTWEACENATEYVIERAESLFGTYEVIKTVTDTTVTLTPQGDNKYANYYRVIAQRNNDADEQSDASNSVSLETTLFGDHTIILAPTDDADKVDELLYALFEKQNDIENDAQFNSEQWQVYFKPGDYTNTSCMYVGFYTSFNGLGKLPTDVKLNNLAVPAYLTDSVSNGQPNATCNFWRSAENLSIVNTGNEKGVASHWSINWRPEAFNWGVAQAAPLRRVASERFVGYDNNWGWASGGYAADCLFTGVDDAGDGAGTYSGQQFYTRNSEITGKAYGTTINNFFQGVKAANLPTVEDYEEKYKDTWKPLESGKGYTNWGLADAEGKQQHFTSINVTDRISEKPFLFFDEKDNEYKVFVPAVRKNTVGTSWGEGKANDGMGEGEILPLSDFYIANPSDSAATINEQIETGKSIYFTPGQYHAEVPIEVNKENTILLGTGMTSIIPDNKETAIKVADVGGVRIEALIFDAGEWSEYLLIVGEKGKHTDHADNPIVLQDLFFRVGGTTNKLTKSDYALEINSDDAIGDHFWIWRADHGAGVKWYGNESYHGLIVNGDDVTCYGLFNEHFQKYDTIWNGENGATYFYQNEKCYDPISQDAWMSHKDTVKGYSAYKVANKVKNHYTVGFGIYNVFIYTGPEYDSSKVSIEMDNAMEVPNRENVIVENACIQTFANDSKALQSFNHIINGVGPGVYSGVDENGEKAEGYSRKFLLYYNNGTAKYGKKPLAEEAEKFVGIDTKTDVKQPMNEEGDIDVAVLVALENLVNTAKFYKESNYTEATWSTFTAKLADAEAEVEKGEDWAVEDEVLAATTSLQAAMDKLEVKAGVDKNAVEKDILDSLKKELSNTITNITSKELKEADYPKAEWKAYQDALKNANTVAKKDTATADEVSNALLDLNIAVKRMEKAGITYQKGLLQQEILKAANLEQTEYKADKWSAYQSALADARTVFLKEDATLEELKTANANLKKAYNDMTGGTDDSENTDNQNKDDENKDDENKDDENKDVQNKEVEKVVISAPTTSLKVGESVTLTAKVEPEDATDKTITWTTSEEEVATVDNGTVTAVAEGTATITATAPNDIKAECTVTVTNDTTPSDGGITNPTDSKNQTDITKPDVTSNNGTQAGKKLTVSSVKIVAESRPYGIKTVYLKKKTKLKLKATVTGSDGINTSVTYASDNKKVATVNSKGQITAKKPGTAVITVRSVQDSEKKAVITVKVVSKASANKALKLKKRKVTLKKKGATAQIQIKKYTKKTTDKVIYKVTAGKKYVKVDKYGVITGKVAPGKKKVTAKVKVTCGKKSAVITVTIPKK